jgi:hypothetical protein
MNAQISGMNGQIKQLHQELLERNRQLFDLLSETADIQKREAIQREMEEINFRVMMAQKLLFKQTTAAIDSQLNTVAAASQDLEKSITRIQKTKDLIKSIGKFLGLVDKVLDLVKLL